MSDAKKLRWGLLAAGNIAKAFARGVARSATGEVVAVGSRDAARAATFAKEFGIPRAHGSYEALLADPGVDAVYISTPHDGHAEWAIRAAEAGKHILCEKPMTVNHAEAMTVIDAVARAGVFFMEAFMYRCHPQTARLVELVREGAVGRVGAIRATFAFRSGFSPQGRLWANERAGGGILDVGCYPASMARLLAGAALGRDFAEPLEVKGCGALHPETGVDQWAAATLSFEGDLVAQLATGVGLAMDNQVVVFGAEGRITVPSPWVVSREGGRSVILVERQGQPPREIAVETSEWLYGLEADTVARHLAARQAPAPAMSWEDSLGNMRTLDRWRQEIGLVYRAERPEALVRPVARRPLARRAPPGVPRRSVPGLALEVSRLVVGLDNTVDLRHWTAMLDALYESGVNCFDTAWIYAGGQLERLLGHWLRTRGVRDDVAVIVKGAHTPCCNPEDLSRQLVESLGRIGTDRADLYFMHRDNPQVPAGEFVDCLNRHVREGRVRVFGGSNWSLARVDEANAYARRQGLQGFGALSNNFSLARMVKPVWAGCIAASDADSRAWFERTQTPLFAWSSQARGFFTRGDPAYRADASLAECWYSDDNFRRLERTRRLARERGVEPLHVALAYVLAQPFPVFPLIGPRSLGEFRSSQRALAVELTERDRRWLNLETD